MRLLHIQDSMEKYVYIDADLKNPISPSGEGREWIMNSFSKENIFTLFYNNAQRQKGLKP